MNEIITDYYMTIDQLQYAGKRSKIKIIYIRGVVSRKLSLGIEEQNNSGGRLKTSLDVRNLI